MHFMYSSGPHFNYSHNRRPQQGTCLQRPKLKRMVAPLLSTRAHFSNIAEQARGGKGHFPNWDERNPLPGTMDQLRNTSWQAMAHNSSVQIACSDLGFKEQIFHAGRSIKACIQNIRTAGE